MREWSPEGTSASRVQQLPRAAQVWTGKCCSLPSEHGREQPELLGQEGWLCVQMQWEGAVVCTRSETSVGTGAHAAADRRFEGPSRA